MLVLGGLLVAGGGLTAAQLMRNGSDSSPTTTTDAAGPQPSARISAPGAVAPSTPGSITTLRGLVDGAVRLSANEIPIEIESGGQFHVLVPQHTASVVLSATDAAGLVTESTVLVTDAPAPAEHPDTVAVHVGAAAWADPVVHQQIVGLVRSGQINAVQLDVKDESGTVGYASEVPLAGTVGATEAAAYDAAAAIAELHGLGVRVIGRVVCFLDPLAAEWAWSQGHREMVVTDASGTAPLANDYGRAAFTNVANTQIRRYQIDLAVEAARLGFDEILYDYVRRPEGDLTGMAFAGLDVPPEVSVARFVDETRQALRADPQTADTALGVSVFGISATRPEPTAQDIGLLAPLVDYVSPMVYPSHWSAGEYGLANPNAQPAEIVGASLIDFRRLIDGSGAAIVPWLQDFSEGGIEYGDSEVRAQITASRLAGSSGFLLWNAGSAYHGGALDAQFPAPG
jgi:hypothetical protein